LARYPRIAHHFITNGLLLTEQWIEMLLCLSTRINFSIDSPRQDVYEYIRQGGKFEDLLRNLTCIQKLERARGERLCRTIAVVVMKSNHLHLAEFVPFALRYGFQGIQFYPVMHITGEENIFLTNAYDGERMEAVRQELASCCDRGGLNFFWHLPRAGGPGLLPFVECRASGQPAAAHCDFPWKALWMCASHGGDIMPDCWCKRPVGNICRNGLFESWNSEEMQRYRACLGAGSVENCNKDCFGIRGEQLRYSQY